MKSWNYVLKLNGHKTLERIWNIIGNWYERIPKYQIHTSNFAGKMPEIQSPNELNIMKSFFSRLSMLFLTAVRLYYCLFVCSFQFRTSTYKWAEPISNNNSFETEYFTLNNWSWIGNYIRTSNNNSCETEYPHVGNLRKKISNSNYHKWLPILWIVASSSIGIETKRCMTGIWLGRNCWANIWLCLSKYYWSSKI